MAFDLGFASNASVAILDQQMAAPQYHSFSLARTSEDQVVESDKTPTHALSSQWGQGNGGG